MEFFILILLAFIMGIKRVLREEINAMSLCAAIM